MLADIIVVGIIAVIFIFCLRKVISGMKNGGCEGCGGNCGHCQTPCHDVKPPVKKQ